MGEIGFPLDAVFSPKTVSQAPEDPLYELITAYNSDKHRDKIDLGVGAYRDDNAKPWILPVVRKANQILQNDPEANHEYLPIAGLPEFNSAAQKLILGENSPAIKDNRVCTFQTISGTGAVHLGGAFLSEFMPKPIPSIHLSTPTWPIHHQCFTQVRLPVAHYPYFLSATKMLDFKGMISALEDAPRRSIILLHACAHNPTGVDPTEEQWIEIAQVMRRNGLFPFFDCAYQGFASGSLTQDNFAIRHFVEQGFELVIAQSFAKNLGLYGQRVGAFHYVASPGAEATETVKRVASQLAILVRSEISSPPLYGAQTTAIILNNEQLLKEWEEDLRTMSGRIIEMRKSLKQELDMLETPGNWDHLVRQIGMFSFTGLSELQVAELRTKWHVYMLGNGRISVAGLNRKNVAYFARAIDDVVRRFGSS